MMMKGAMVLFLMSHFIKTAVLLLIIISGCIATLVLAFSLSSKPSLSSFQVSKVPKVDSKEFDLHKHYFHSKVIKNKNDDLNSNTSIQYEYETPVLIENALSQSLCEEICNSLVTHLGHITVDVQRNGRITEKIDDSNNNDNNKNGGGNVNVQTSTDIYQCSLNEAFNLMMESKHNDSFFCFSEGLLDNIEERDEDDENDIYSIMSSMKEIITSSKEKLFGNYDVRIEDDSMNDIFSYFPKDVQPSDCVVIAGEGATSTLHRDPFSWTGTSLCLEGTKVWRFIAPPGALQGCDITHDDSHYDQSGVSYVDQVLNSYRLPSIAWNRNGQGNNLYISSGWQSAFSLYSSFTNFETFPSAEELAYMDEDKKIKLIENLAESIDELSPNCPTSYFEELKDKNNNQISIWTVVQKPGDLLVIPAFWWHQTLALEPSIAVASQRCSQERDYSRVFKHILDTSCDIKNNNYPQLVNEDYLTNHRPEEAVNKLFKLISQRK